MKFVIDELPKHGSVVFRQANKEGYPVQFGREFRMPIGYWIQEGRKVELEITYN